MNCPICHQPLHKENRTWKCPNNHAFDQARQGYVNLCRKQKVTGDNEAMSAARTRFLESGAYDFLREAINAVHLSFTSSLTNQVSSS
ncbi:putative RNA methyltransferase, partial [uncultured Allobaculum sp.]